MTLSLPESLAAFRLEERDTFFTRSSKKRVYYIEWEFLYPFLKNSCIIFLLVYWSTITHAFSLITSDKNTGKTNVLKNSSIIFQIARKKRS